MQCKHIKISVQIPPLVEDAPSCPVRRDSKTAGRPVPVEARKALLLPFGYSDKELADRGADDLLVMIEREMQRLQGQMMVPTIKGVQGPVQRVVPNADLPRLFEGGWTFKASLGNGQSIVEAPVG